MKNTIQINFKDIVKIQHYLMDIFAYEDSWMDREEYREKCKLERKVEKLLKTISEDGEKRREIEDIIYRGMWRTDDGSFMWICDELTRKGYEVLVQIKKGETVVHQIGKESKNA